MLKYNIKIHNNQETLKPEEADAYARIQIEINKNNLRSIYN